MRRQTLSLLAARPEVAPKLTTHELPLHEADMNVMSEHNPVTNGYPLSSSTAIRPSKEFRRPGQTLRRTVPLTC